MHCRHVATRWDIERVDNETAQEDDAQFSRFQDYCSDNYHEFAGLMHIDSALAADEFGAETIDLLHLDGLRTYEAAILRVCKMVSKGSSRRRRVASQYFHSKQCKPRRLWRVETLGGDKEAPPDVSVLSRLRPGSLDEE